MKNRTVLKRFIALFTCAVLLVSVVVGNNIFVTGAETTPAEIILIDDEAGKHIDFSDVSDEQVKVGEKSLKNKPLGTKWRDYWIMKGNLPTAVNITEITENGTSGAIRFWIWVESRAEVMLTWSGSQFQIGAAWDKNVYKWDNWDTQIRNAGWNEIVLPFSQAKKIGTPDNSSLKFILMRTGNTKYDMDVYVDNLRVSSDDSATEYVIDSSLVLSDEDGENPGFCATVSNEQAKVGEFSYKATTGEGDHEGWMIRTTLTRKMDISEKTENGTKGTLRFWLYVEDTNIEEWGPSGNTQVQFGEAWDKNVYVWKGWESQVKVSGWNEIILPLAAAEKRGTPNNSSIQYFFIKIGNTKHKMTAYIDYIHIAEDIQTEPRDPAVVISEEHMESAGGFCASISDAVVKVGKASYKATPGHGDVENWMVRTNLAKPLDMTDYQSGSLTFWIWVEKREDVILNWNGSQAQLGAAWDKNVYRWDNWDTQIVNDGWNLITLPFGDAKIVGGTPDVANIKYINIRMNNTKYKTVVYLDDIRGVKETATAVEKTIDPKIVLSEEDGENGGFCTAISNEKVKVGDFAYKTTTGGKNEAWILRTTLARTLDITKTTANATKGSLTFWIYVEDKNDAKNNWNGSQVQLGKGWDKDVFIWNAWDTQIKQNGWNKIVLNFTAAGTTGTPELNNITYFFIKTFNNNHICTVYVDDIRISTEELVSDWSTTIDGATMFQPFEDTIKISTDQVKKTYLDTDDKKQGDSSFAMITDKGQFHFVYKPVSAVDASKYNCLEFDIYVSNPDFFSFGSGQLELTSSGTMDQEEMSWSLGSLELNKGWNHIQLSFERANFTLDWKYERNINLAAINYMRIYATGASLYNGTEVLFKLDNMQFTNNGLPPEEEKTYETVNDTGLEIYLTAAEGIIPQYGTFTVTNAESKDLPEAMQKIMKQDSGAKALSLEFMYDGMQLLMEDVVKVNVKRGNIFKVADDLHIYKIDENNNITELVVEKRSDLVAFSEGQKLARYVFTTVPYTAEETPVSTDSGISPIVVWVSVAGGVLVVAAAAVIMVIYFKRKKALK